MSVRPPSKEQPHNPTSTTAAPSKSLRQEKLSRLFSSRPCDTSSDHAQSYFLRRENRLSAKKKADEETMNNDYQRMYEKALATNQRLKSRLETSKQELGLMEDQLQRAQKGRLGDCSADVIEAEQKESWSMKKKICDLEEQLKAKEELKKENQRLKDENGALIRVITKLSK